jgi:hypothetical protein
MWGEKLLVTPKAPYNDIQAILYNGVGADGERNKK